MENLPWELNPTIFRKIYSFRMKYFLSFYITYFFGNGSSKSINPSKSMICDDPGCSAAGRSGGAAGTRRTSGSVTRTATGVPESSNMPGMMWVLSIPISMAIGGPHSRPQVSAKKKQFFKRIPIIEKRQVYLLMDFVMFQLFKKF